MASTMEITWRSLEAEAMTNASVMYELVARRR